jgi:hypothetical protein
MRYVSRNLGASRYVSVAQSRQFGRFSKGRASVLKVNSRRGCVGRGFGQGFSFAALLEARKTIAPSGQFDLNDIARDVAR